ncbi:hypothetical protein, partial [Xanthomonas arboricola]
MAWIGAFRPGIAAACFSAAAPRRQRLSMYHALATPASTPLRWSWVNLRSRNQPPACDARGSAHKAAKKNPAV